MGWLATKCSPQYLDELGHCDMVRHQELGLVEQRQVLLVGETLDNDGYLVGVQLSDHVSIFHSLT